MMPPGPVQTLRTLAMLAMAGLYAACATAPTSASAQSGGSSTIADEMMASKCASDRARRILELANAARSEAGIGPLRCAPELAEIAQRHAEDMCRHDYLSHTSLDGRTMQDRVDESDIDYQFLGENIAMGQRTPRRVHKGWMGSPHHRENILREVFRRVGLGYIQCNGQPIWVQIFAD